MSYRERNVNRASPYGGYALLRRADDEVLLVASRLNGAVHWHLPGGPVRLGETAREACQRHARKQLGLHVEPGRRLVAEQTAREGHQHIFACPWPEGAEIALGREVAAWRWVAPGDLGDTTTPSTVWLISGAIRELRVQAART